MRTSGHPRRKDRNFLNSPFPFQEGFAAIRRHPRTPRRTRIALIIAASAVAISITAIAVAVPEATRGPSAVELLETYVDENPQSLTVSTDVVVASIVRDTYSATPGIQTLAAGGTNHDWAKLVLLLAGFPMSEENVTVFTRWMRQENGVDDWWNRNNPLNNGWGSGGGGGLGSYDNLVIAAENAAEALHSNPGYSGIVEAFAASAPTEVTEAAIWASPWATSHYHNGGHWSYAPVPVVTAPSEAW